MRNHLAEDMLNGDMLNIVTKYRESLENQSCLNGLIKLLQVTSKLIYVFRDEKPITSCSDEKFVSVKHCEEFFKQWMFSLKHSSTKLSRECLEDALNLTVTFPIVCKRFLSDFPGASFYPHRFNSDIVENHFCQSRGLCNGDLTHPTYATYQSSINSIILGQTSISVLKN